MSASIEEIGLSFDIEEVQRARFEVDPQGIADVHPYKSRLQQRDGILSVPGLQDGVGPRRLNRFQDYLQPVSQLECRVWGLRESVATLAQHSGADR